MYETEVNIRTASPAELPPGVLSAFGTHETEVTARTLLPWSEHCTECVWPTCYTSCDLYEPREDSRCRRFVDGMVRIDSPQSLNSYLLRIRFKRWGKLWAPGSMRLHSVAEARKLERRDHRIGTTLYQLPLPAGLKQTITGKRYSFKKRIAQRRALASDPPDSFLVECFNPGDEAVPLSLTIRSMNPERKIPFQKLIQLRPGFQRERIPVGEIACVVDLASPFSIEMIPNEVPEGTTLYFGALDFVREAQIAVAEIAKPAFENGTKTGSKKVKCVVWDLDNTMWDGILVEDGPEKLRLKPGIAEVIRELDGRGILNSIASKNNHDEALQVLKRFELDDYFVFPQISWSPKSQALKTIANDLNIGLNTLLFIDDSNFELQEIRAACPDVRVVPAADYRALPAMEICQVPVTEEAKGRRKMYQVDMIRQATASSFWPGLSAVPAAMQHKTAHSPHDCRESGPGARTDAAHQPDEFLRQPLQPGSAEGSAGDRLPGHLRTELRRSLRRLRGDRVLAGGPARAADDRSDVQLPGAVEDEWSMLPRVI